MTKLRRDAYAVVDERSGGQCEMPWVEPGFPEGTLASTIPVKRCHRPATEHQHRRPRRSGGSSDPATESAANIFAICTHHHHNVVESYRRLAYNFGWLVRASHDPASVPVLTWQGLVLLGEDGSVTPATSEVA